MESQITPVMLETRAVFTMIMTGALHEQNTKKLFLRPSQTVDKPGIGCHSQGSIVEAKSKLCSYSK